MYVHTVAFNDVPYLLFAPTVDGAPVVDMALTTAGMELASEMILKAARSGLKIADVPVPYAERQGEAKLNTFRDGWRHLRFLVLASPNYLFTIPGALFTLLGLVILLAALPNNQIEVGSLTWQPVFAGSIFVVVGVNALLLGFASRLYTNAVGLTNEDAFVRFYRRFLSLEVFVLFGFLLVVAGLVLNAVLLFTQPGELNINIAAIAQTLIVVGANAGLVGALTSLLDDKRR